MSNEMLKEAYKLYRECLRKRDLGLTVKTIQFIQKITSKQLSKLESANYIGVSRATFDNYINRGLIPKGIKRLGFKELSWNKYDLDKFIKEND